jgi:energy-coupling factor transporter ATP-binding protein EcfA2
MTDSLRLRRLRLRNWKAFKDCTIVLNKGLNVLVGPNASGKTSLLEAFKFLKKALGEFEAPYAPHLEWWTYRNIVYGNDETKPIIFELEFECPEGYTAIYEVAFTGAGGVVKPYGEKLHLVGVLSFTREGDSIQIEYDDGFLKRIGRKREKRMTFRMPVGELITIFRTPLLRLTEDFSPDIFLSRGVDESFLMASLLDYLITPHRKDYPTIKKSIERLKILSPRLKSEQKSLFTYVLYNIPKFFRQILFIRHPDMGALRQPIPFITLLLEPISLNERGGNLSLLIHRWFHDKGRLPDRIDHALKNLFPDLAISTAFTADGRVFLLVKDNTYGAELHPPSVPDGFYKMLHVMSAIETNPSILLIDELENSLHAEALEYIVEELKDAGITSIVATHSPVVIDVAGLEHLLLVERTPEGSKVKRVENIEEMKRWMREKGLTPSEMWLYGM